MEYRDFLDLTDDEVRFIINEIFKPIKIDNIGRSKEWREITCEITMLWGTEDSGGLGAITDEIVLREGEIQVDFSFNKSDELKWRKYLIAKGCHFLLKDNPYIKQGN